MKKILLLFILLVSVRIYCDAQNYSEVVYLKNGSVIRGLIVEQIPDVSIKIKTYDGSLIICRMDEVLRIENGRLYKKYYNPTQSTLKGYKGFVDFGYVVDVSGHHASKIELSTSHGYQFNNYFFLGGGVAVSHFTDANLTTVPFFINFKANFINRPITPFMELRTGYSAGDIEGLYSTLGAGVRFALRNKMALNLKLEYNLQEYDIPDYYWDSSYDLHGIGIKIGFEF